MHPSLRVAGYNGYDLADTFVVVVLCVGAGSGVHLGVKVLGRVPLSEEVVTLRLVVCQPTSGRFCSLDFLTKRMCFLRSTLRIQVERAHK